MQRFSQISTQPTDCLVIFHRISTSVSRKKQSILGISLSRNIVSANHGYFSKYNRAPNLIGSEFYFIFFIICRENTDIGDVAHLIVFIRVVDKDLIVTGELLEMLPLIHSTTEDYIFST